MSFSQKIVLEVFVLKILIFYIVHIFNLINLLAIGAVIY